jgi:hypothetical protein
MQEWLIGILTKLKVPVDDWKEFAFDRMDFTPVKTSEEIAAE